MKTIQLIAIVAISACFGTLTSAYAQEGQIVKVEPNNGPPYYQVHYLKVGEKPSYYNYNCWGCSGDDYQKIFKETGLWYWNLGAP